MAIGLYVHIPFCVEKCNYCNFYSVPIASHQTDKVLDCIITELENRLEDKVETIYIGGGSPSCLGSDLTGFVDRIIEIAGEADEFTIELNPQQVDIGLLKSLRQAGVNRISIGAQSLNDSELKFLGRQYSSSMITKAVKLVQKAGIDNISLDFIYAIPGQTLKSWQETLNAATKLPITHISAYSLSFEEGTNLTNMLKAEKIEKVEEEIDRMMYDNTIDSLRNAGMKQYEISNFSKPEFQCIHNLKYWNNDEYLGIGPAAGSFYKGQRTLNFANIDKYVTAIDNDISVFDEVSTPNELEFACECAVLGLRKVVGITLSDFYDRTGYDFMELFEKPIEFYRDQKLLLVEPNDVRLSRKAMPIADSILSDFSYI